MIKYINRYSNTDLPDNMGRWARLVEYKNIRIAWISRIESHGKVMFLARCYFPTMRNDTANENKVCKSLDDAKEFVSERWEWFLNEVK